MININEQRLLKTLSHQSQYGRLPPEQGGGLDRQSFSIGDRNVRDYFCRHAKAALLEVIMDGAANLSAKLKCSDPNAPTLLLGSHLDSVPNGGALDGALGVWAALEVLCTVSENNIDLPVHLEAIVFTDEEGRLGELFGSQAIVGGHTTESAEGFLAQASQFPEDLKLMRQMIPGSLTPEAIMAAHRPKETLAGYLELHIEQGPQLEHANLPIGVVDSIFGRRSCVIKFLGRSGHAGTTPMHLRADALIAAAQFIIQAPQQLKVQFENCVLTCGNVNVKPGVYNVIPSEATVWVEFRASTEIALNLIDDMINQLASEITSSPKLSFSIHQNDQLEAVAMDETIQSTIQQVCEKLNYPCMILSSGAVHDATLMATVAPTGMIFVPSKEGLSHNPNEDTDPQDLIAGANVLLHTALALAQNN